MFHSHRLNGARDDTLRRTYFGISITGLVALGAILAAVVVVRKILSQSHSSHQLKTSEQRRDKILKDTFPASDPPSSQYFDIPVNRQ